MSSDNGIFMAVPMEGSPFEHLISGGGGRGNSSPSSGSSSVKRQERLKLAMQIAIVVFGISALGLILGFSIAAIKHHRHHHHHLGHYQHLQEAMIVESHNAQEVPTTTTKTHSDPTFWGVKREHNQMAENRLHHKERPQRRHSPYADSSTTATATTSTATATARKGFWANGQRTATATSSNSNSNSNQLRLRHHERPNNKVPTEEMETIPIDYDDFFPTEDDEVQEMTPVETIKAMGGK